MMTEQQADELLSVLSRIAHSLERVAAVVDPEENEFSVYVRGDVNLGDDEEDEEEEEEETEGVEAEETY